MTPFAPGRGSNKPSPRTSLTVCAVSRPALIHHTPWQIRKSILPPTPPPPSHPTQQLPPDLSVRANEPWQSEYNPPPPPQPPRPQDLGSATTQLRDTNPTATTQLSNEPPAPPLPQRHGNSVVEAAAPTYPPAYNPGEYAGQQSFQSGQQFQPPPQRLKQTFAVDDDPSSPVHYIRDPHKLIGYLVPFPKPKLSNVKPEDVPSRFMIYTPPPPPLQKPAEGVKEAQTAQGAAQMARGSP